MIPEPEDKLDAMPALVGAVSGLEDATLDWRQIDWRHAEREVRRLRQRIFTASRAGDLARVRRLQILMLRSRSNTLVSVRRVTERNAGRLTAGVDGEIALTPRTKEQLVARVHDPADAFKAMPVRRVFIPKPGGKQRPLGIPVILDRVHQARIVNALEPEWEARFEPKSYGFRPGRGCHDAIEAIFQVAKQNPRRLWVLDADLAGAFDRIGHNHLISMIGSFPARGMIRQWLKAGVVENGRLFRTEEGTPQGGVASPLLLNIALHGMETAAGARYKADGHAKTGTPVLIRYADDCVPRTLKEDRCRRRCQLKRCCTRDEGVTPLGVVALRGRPAGGGRKPPRGASVKSRGAERRGKGALSARQVWITKASESEPPLKCRKRIGDIQNRGRVIAPGSAWREPADWPGECPAWMVARAWSGLLCGTREPVAPMGRLTSGAVWACGWSSGARTQAADLRGESSDAGHRGGPDRSSYEGPVMGLERRGRVVLAGFQVNHLRVGGAG
jgi:RNA-directed DNA polymerase